MLLHEHVPARQCNSSKAVDSVTQITRSLWPVISTVTSKHALGIVYYSTVGLHSHSFCSVLLENCGAKLAVNDALPRGVDDEEGVYHLEPEEATNE